MDNTLSLEQFEAFYKAALIGHEHAHYSIKCDKSVDELQQRCRICRCINDGTFVELDALQNFEFDATITSYRQLLQRSSLQFQFHTMPDLPSRICIRCGYKGKIFYLLTRQFVHGQTEMRSAIIEWYHNTFKVEAPEQLDDKIELLKQLELAKADLNKKCIEKLKMDQTTLKNVIKDCEKKGMPKLRRSSSSDELINAKYIKNKANLKKKMPVERMSLKDSRVNLRPTPNQNEPVTKAAKVNPNPNQKFKMDQTSLRNVIKDCEKKVMPKLKSSDDLMDAKDSKNKENIKIKMLDSRVNLRPAPNQNGSVTKATKGNPNLNSKPNPVKKSTKTQQCQTARTEISNFVFSKNPIRENTVILNRADTPKISKMPWKLHSNLKIAQTAAANGSVKSEGSLNKTQYQQKLQERRKLWK